MRLLPLVLAALALAAPASAQRRTPNPLHGAPLPFSATVREPDSGALPRTARAEGDRPALVLALGGAVGGGVGMFGGMAAGELRDGGPRNCEDMCFGPGIILGTLAGEAIGVAVGTHLANGRRGRLIPGLLTSGGILAAGIAAGLVAPPVLLAIPPAQIIGSIGAERATQHR